MNLDDHISLINVDRAQIQQIILNLIINASESLGDNLGSIQINTGAEYCSLDQLNQSPWNEAALPGKYAYIEVIDSGCGMDPSVLAHLFEPFYTTKFAGRGLGLSAVIGIVKRHKGVIFVESQLNKGTKFKILFPIMESKNNEQAINVNDIPQSGFIKFFHASVLLVDDEESIVRVGDSMLKKLGFRVQTAENGSQALEIFKKDPNKFDLVILDLTMPQMDGLTVFLEMKNIRPDQKIVLSSGFDAQEVTLKFADKGLTGFLQKPYQYHQLKSELERIYRQYHSS